MVWLNIELPALQLATANIRGRYVNSDAEFDLSLGAKWKHYQYGEFKQVCTFPIRVVFFFLLTFTFFRYIYDNQDRHTRTL